MNEEYVDPTENLSKLTGSPSMYMRIKTWLLQGRDEDEPELIQGALINLKVVSGNN